MSQNDKFDEAKKLIEGFSEELFVLANTTEIPEHWIIYLKKCLQPKPGKSGRKYDVDLVERVVTEITSRYQDISAPHTKHHNPGKIKDEIADKLGVSRKTVDRYFTHVKSYLGGISDPPDDIRKAVINGISEAIHQEICAEEAQIRDSRQ